jgi:hypothetical protein
MVSVVTEPTGQFVTVGAHDVTVYVEVVYTVDTVNEVEELLLTLIVEVWPKVELGSVVAWTPLVDVELDVGRLILVEVVEVELVVDEVVEVELVVDEVTDPNS